MADVKLLAPKILKWESDRFTNIPGDLGGATKCGITFKTFQPWFFKKYGRIATLDDLKNMSNDDFIELLKELFWDTCQGDRINDQQLANIIVDWFWGSGYAAIGDIQKMYGITPTDFLGPQTLAAINGANPVTATNTIVSMRINFYRAIVERDPSQQKFLQGWINRANDYAYKPASV